MSDRLGVHRLTLATMVLTATMCAAEGGPAGARPWPQLRDESFQLVWTTVNASHYDPAFGGVDWAAVRERYAARLPGTESVDDLRELLQGMLNELGSSHFAIMPREMAVFAPEERNRHGTTGADVTWVDGKLVLAEIEPDSAAARAGLKPGAVIERIDGQPLAQFAQTLAGSGVEPTKVGQLVAAFVTTRLGAPVDTELELAGLAADGAPWTVTLRAEGRGGAWSEPLGNTPSVPLRCEARRDPDGIGYLRFNVFAPGLMKEIRTLLRSLGREDGLVVDLRGNPGGVIQMAPAIAGWLIAQQATLGSTRLRQGQTHFVAYPQPDAFHGPLAVLIDGESSSTSEVFAAGLQAIGRARIFGERSAGAALPSAFLKLPTGDLLQYAIGDVVTPRGASIEGRGVQPDERVTRTADDIAKGYDPVLQTARDWIDARRQEKGRR